MAAKDHWTDTENDALVATYFGMLADELSGRQYSKAGVNRRLQTAIGRSRGSIEYKMQNLSAALRDLGETWIIGYRPASNYQDALAEAATRWLHAHPEWVDRLPAWAKSVPSAGQREAAAALAALDFGPLPIEPAPTVKNAPPPDDLDRSLATAQKFDVVERDARNRALGRAGEFRALVHERATLIRAGRSDLADRVRWTSDEEGDGAGYDIASFEPDGHPRLLEIKATNGAARTPFYISTNELAVSKAREREWRLLRLYDISREPKAFELRSPLDAHVSLIATAYRADFRSANP